MLYIYGKASALLHIEMAKAKVRQYRKLAKIIENESKKEKTGLTIIIKRRRLIRIDIIKENSVAVLNYLVYHIEVSSLVERLLKFKGISIISSKKGGVHGI